MNKAWIKHSELENNCVLILMDSTLVLSTINFNRGMTEGYLCQYIEKNYLHDISCNIGFLK